MTVLENPCPAWARVAFFAHGHARVVTDDAEFPALAAPWLEPVVVGDLVDLQPNDPPLMVGRRPRSTTLVRRDPGGGPQNVAANVDRALICMSCDGDFNERRLERWRIVVEECDLAATVLLTKADRPHDGSAASVADLIGVARRVFDDVIPVSAVTGAGLDEVRGRLVPGHTFVLLGSSGVGKSTLTNALLGVEAMPTRPVREDDRGRHTTSNRHLMRLPGGAWWIDSPGVRAVGPLADADLSSVFDDVATLVSACRFRDCHHDGEPGCAVIAAIDDGTLEPERFSAWQKLERELAYESRRGDRRAEAEQRQKWKRIHKTQRARYRDKYGGYE